MGLRKLSPGGYEYLTGSVACADRALEPGESLSDYYLAHGYPPGTWIGAGAAELGVSGQVTAAQMNALFGEGRHPNANAIERELISNGASADEAHRTTRLGRRFAQYSGIDELRSQIIDAYKQYNLDHGRPVGAPLDDRTRAVIRHQVQTRLFETAHGGRRPADEKELTAWLAKQSRQLKTAVAGYEAVLAPPKSVSVVWALADPTTRERIAAAHRQAVRDTVLHIEANAAFTRRGDRGEAQVDVTGITAALFEHWDSRAGDPHLHTHVPISNKVKRADDGAWTSLDGRTMLAAVVTMSEFYNSRVRDLLRDEGAVWVRQPEHGIDRKRPVWELDGVPTELLTGFSRRAQEVEIDRANRIVAFRNEHGREPEPRELLEIGKRAQYGTRAAKQAPKTLDQHRGRWRDFAETVVEPAALDGLSTRVFAGRGESLSDIDISKLAEVTRFVVSDNYSHFNRWNIEAEAHRQTAHLRVGTADRADLAVRIVNAVVNAEGTVALRGPALVAEPARLRRRSGESVFFEHNSERYTTDQTLREESELVAYAQRRGGQRLSADTVDNALSGARLNRGQRQMVTEFARSGLRLQLALAPAGAGKTTAMRVLATAWRSAGGRVYAFGPSARAAQELGDAIDAKPHTLHQVTTALDVGVAETAYGFHAKDLLIVDEAAMSGTHTLHAVVRYALSRGADVRLVGDDKQLGAVEAGGAIRLIAYEAGAVRFREVVRFHDPDQAAASLRIREGDPGGIGYYVDQGWVVGGSRETMRDEAQHAWRADLDAGRQTLLIVPTNEDVVWLNLQARAQRIGLHQVRQDAHADLHDGTRASPGDWVVTRDNNRLLALFGGKDFVKNGDIWTVVAVHDDGALRVTHQAHHGTTVLPAAYVATHVELAYATTVNRTQGMTSEASAHTVVPQTMSREQLYPAITRARYDNRLYVETHQHVVDGHQETPPPETIEAVLTGVLKHSGVETAATEELRAALGIEESLATLVGRYEYAVRLDSDERFNRILEEHAPEVLGQPAESALVQTLRNAEGLGWQAERLVPAAVSERSLTDADDPAAVLQWRIDRRLQRGEQPPRGEQALPWMAPPRIGEPDLAQYVRATNSAIAARAAELRAQVAVEQPPWTAGLGPRPKTPEAAQQWDDVAGLAAAYRETFGISGDDPAAPIGPEPDGTNATARAWRAITGRWRPPMTDPADELRAENQRRIDELRESLTESAAPPDVVGVRGRMDDFADDVDPGETASEDHGLDSGLTP